MTWELTDEETGDMRTGRGEGRRGIKSSSGSGDYERSRPREVPTRAPSSKRTSWFKKLTTL
jgi:hypothetical protein